MEADDCQVTVFTVQPSFHHRHSTNPSIIKRYHRGRPCSHTSPRRSPTMVTLHDTRFVECRWWDDGWTVKTVVVWRPSTSMIPAPEDKHGSMCNKHALWLRNRKTFCCPVFYKRPAIGEELTAGWNSLHQNLVVTWRSSAFMIPAPGLAKMAPRTCSTITMCVLSALPSRPDCSCTRELKKMGTVITRTVLIVFLRTSRRRGGGG